MSSLKAAGVTAVLSILLAPFTGLLSPLLSGLIGGYIASDPRRGLSGAMLGGLLAGIFMLILGALVPMRPPVMLSHVIAAAIVFLLWMTLLAGLGGLLGGFFGSKRSS